MRATAAAGVPLSGSLMKPLRRGFALWRALSLITKLGRGAMMWVDGARWKREWEWAWDSG